MAVEVREFEGLAHYQEAVGGWIEPIEIPALGICLYLNEEGRLRKLPFNPRATFLAWFHLPELRQRVMLFGAAVIVGAADEQGETTDVPGDIEHVLDPGAQFSLEVRVGSASEWHRHPGALGYFDAAVLAMVVAERSPLPTEIRIRTLGGVAREAATVICRRLFHVLGLSSSPRSSSGGARPARQG